jgi:hypothetical protein
LILIQVRAGHLDRATPGLEIHASEDAPGGAEASGTLSAVLTQRAELLNRLGVADWHAAGYRGQGIKVAVLDSGFRGFRAYLGRELPDHLSSRSFRADGNLEAKDSRHGILCGEVVHAYAPAAELIFVNWEPDVPETFLDAVRWAKEQGARVLTCSLIMPSWSDGEGRGPVHAVLTRLLGSEKSPGEILCFASAGNTAQRHWAGPYHPGRNGDHEWVPGEAKNGLSPWGEEEVSVEMCWQGSGDFDLRVSDRATNKEEARSLARTNGDRSTAVARFLPKTGHSYDVRVRLARGSPGPFHLVALGAWLNHSTARGSIPFPGDGEDVISVGAVTAAGERMAYSSCGPNSRKPKPDLVAPVPFPSLLRARPFGGTSASAPQAAGMAALCLSRHPGWSGAQVRHALEKAAKDLGPPGHDCETGYGMIRMPVE